MSNGFSEKIANRRAERTGEDERRPEQLLQDTALAYSGSEPILVEAWKRYQQSASGVGESETLRSDSPVEQISKKLENITR